MIERQSSSYGVSRITVAESGLDLVTEEILRCGYAVVDSGLSEGEIDRYRQLLDAIYAVQQEEVGGEDNLRRINDANVARCLLAYNDAFLGLATNDIVLRIVRRILGENFVLLMQNGVINPPNLRHYQVNWHRDLNYQHWVCSRPLALSFLVCLDPFSRETGGTHFLAGSHLKEEFPSEAFIRGHEKVVEAEPGTVIVFDSMTFHRAGENTSHIVRRAVNHVVGMPILGQQISIPDMLQGRYSDHEFLSRYLGYHWNPQSGVVPWRLKKLHAVEKTRLRKGA
jgi:hypothetical protein